MRSAFHAEIVNNPFEDPVLYVRALYEKRVMLFDLGNIDALGPGRINNITEVFVTHMHIDHFIGFDTLLRYLLKRDEPVSIYGPQGIIDCVSGKLRGYTWNLIRDYPLKIEVYEILDGQINHAGFYAEREFVRTDHSPKTFNNPIISNPSYKLSALILSHQIPVIAYCLEEDIHININKALLLERGLPMGKWLAELKNLIRTGSPDDSVLMINNKEYSLSMLRELAVITKGHKLCYVMDTAPTEENIARLMPFIKDADFLYCESFFSNAERERSLQRHHLTALMAGTMARHAGVKNLKVMHFSQKYKSEPELLLKEAEDAFNGLVQDNEAEKLS